MDKYQCWVNDLMICIRRTKEIGTFNETNANHVIFPTLIFLSVVLLDFRMHSSKSLITSRPNVLHHAGLYILNTSPV